MEPGVARHKAEQDAAAQQVKVRLVRILGSGFTDVCVGVMWTFVL